MSRRGRIPIPAIERIMRRCSTIDRGYVTPCKIISGAHFRGGYGQITIGSRTDGSNRSAYAHVVVWEHHHGPVPDGLELDHLCGQPACCEVTHLEPVTHAENIRRGRAAKATAERHARITRCPQGHKYTAENTRVRITRRGYRNRQCRQCQRAACRRYYLNRKATVRA